MNLATDRRDNRFFDGDASELVKIKSMESLQRFERAQRNRRNAARLFRVLIFLALCIAFLLLCVNVFFVIRQVEVEGCDRYSGDELIELAGIEMGDSLYSINAGSFEGLIGRLSNIREISFRRVLPGTLVIVLVEDSAEYVTELYGEYFTLSSDLRVLEWLHEPDVRGLGLMELVLPELDLAIVGSKLVFEDETAERYIKAYLEVVRSSPIGDDVDAFDLSDRFHLRMICGGYRFLCELAGGDDLATKLSTLDQIISHSALTEKGAARIDVTNPEEGRVNVTGEANITFDN